MRPCGTYNVSYAEDRAIMRTRLQWLLLIAGLALSALVPVFVGSGHLLSFFTNIFITIILVLGLNILSGNCGQISIGQAAFLGVGAYASGIATAKLGLSFWLALPFAGIVTALVGLVFGLPSLRLKGFYLAMSTLAAQFILIYLFLHLTWLTGGSEGLYVPRPQLGGIVLSTPQSYYWLCLVVLVVMTYFAKNIMRSKAGRAFVAIRDNDLAAEVMGINVFGYKLLAFSIAAFYAGIAGSLWGHFQTCFRPDAFTLMDSVWYLGMIVVGGMGSVVGSYFGVIAIDGLSEVINIYAPALGRLMPALSGVIVASLSITIFGVIVLLILIFEPRGLAHRWEMFKNTYRLWPFSY